MLDHHPNLPPIVREIFVQKDADLSKTYAALKRGYELIAKIDSRFEEAYKYEREWKLEWAVKNVAAIIGASVFDQQVFALLLCIRNDAKNKPPITASGRLAENVHVMQRYFLAR